MKRNQIQHVRIHFVPSPDGKSIAERANQYHLQLIERRLNESALSPMQKTEVLTRIIQLLSSNL